MGYIPTKHDEFNNWQIQFVDGLLTDPLTGNPAPFPPAPGADPANWVNWEIPEANMQVVVDGQAAYQPLYNDWSDEDARNRDKVVAQDEGRKIYEKLIRDFTGEWLRDNQNVDNAAKAFLGLTVPDTEPTAVTPVDYGPQLSIDTIRPMLHKIRVADPTNPTTQAMPKGHKLVVERFIGTAGLEAGDINWSVYKQTGKFLVNSQFDAEDAGKTAYYRARYVTTRGDFTIYGNTLEAVIS